MNIHENHHKKIATKTGKITSPSQAMYPAPTIAGLNDNP
jgi:hypothetical protein